MKAKIIAIVVAVVLIGGFAAYMLRPKPGAAKAELLTRVTKYIEQQRSSNASEPGGPDRIRREDQALAFLKTLKPQYLPTDDEVNHVVLIPNGMWHASANTPGRQLGLAELYTTYMHSLGGDFKVEIDASPDRFVAAKENDDGTIELTGLGN